MPRRFYFRTTESDAAGFVAGNFKSAAMDRAINNYPEGDPAGHDPTSMDPHPTAFLVEDFGRTYESYAAWKASLAGRYTSHTVNDSKASFDAVRTFNGNETLKITDGGGANLFLTLSPLRRRVWMRSFVWIDAGYAAGDDCYLGALVFHNSTFPHPAYNKGFPGELVYVNDAWEPELPGLVSYYYDDFTPYALATVPFDDIKGRWASVLQLAELEDVTSRFRVWLDGAEVIDSTWAVTSMAGIDFHQIQLAFGTDDPGNICNYGLVEYHFGDNPYGVLTP